MPIKQWAYSASAAKRGKMSKFTEAFYKTYYATKKDLEAAKESWEDEITSYISDICPHRLAELHEQQVKLYEELVRLEKLWGVYCVTYTEAVSEREKAYAEDESLKELTMITGEAK